MPRRLLPLLLALGLLGALLAGCEEEDRTLRIASGSENSTLEPMIAEWGRENGVAVEMAYMGSAEIARALQVGEAIPFDAVWPANSLWLAMGDTAGVTRHAASIFRSPVVLAVQPEVAGALGWTADTEVTVAMIAEAASDGRLPLAMTSATQSNSGASALFSFLYAFAGNPDVLTLEHLEDPAVVEDLTTLLGSIDRSSGSSQWLKDALLENPDAFGSMINYESLAIEANRELVAAGRDPLRVFYPADAIAVADSPLAFVDRGEDEAAEEAFLELQAFLLSEDTQARLLAEGRRAGPLGVAASPEGAWPAEWGVDLGRGVSPVPVPSEEVVARALDLYQTRWRKPSLTIWLLDVSGSMEGEPIADLRSAMDLLLDPEKAALNLLQPTPEDVTILIPFNDGVLGPERFDGNDPAVLAEARAATQGLQAQGGTDIYRALGEAVDLLEELDAQGATEGRLVAIAAMSDGQSDTGLRDEALAAYQQSPFHRVVPIHTIAFGDADQEQLDALAAISTGRSFTAGDDLAGALRSVRGYN